MPRKKKSQKPTAVQRELNANWARLLVEHSKKLERGAEAKGITLVMAKQKALLSPPHVSGEERESNLRSVKSKGTGIGNATRAKDKTYTGTAMLGIGTLHKSNSVPVFQQEDALDIAKMRR
jgi:hypothetical protein